jgi:phosphoglycolate phosphatase-like HAD superfamily hydrolase
MDLKNPGRRRVLLGGVMLAAVPAFSTIASAQSSDPLPSWNDGPRKKAITGFVSRVTAKDSKAFIKPADRIATFDNDGTLWSEQPMYFQLAFALDRLAVVTGKPPDMKEIMKGGEKGLLEVVMKTHSGITTDEFNKVVADWFRTARHPRFKQPYSALVYQPMIELLRYLRANGFKTFIVSGGGVEFMRVFADQAYGIPPEQVIGSAGVTKFQPGKDGKPVLMKEPKVEFIDDGPGKPEAINRIIGRRPVFAFGNSDGDLQMLQWTYAGAGARFAGIVHHTDAEREWAYDRTSAIGKLDKALDQANKDGWTVVNMKTDWKVIYPFEMKRSK